MSISTFVTAGPHICLRAVCEQLKKGPQVSGFINCTRWKQTSSSGEMLPALCYEHVRIKFLPEAFLKKTWRRDEHP